MFTASPLEILAVAASLASVWLTIRRHIACWPVGLIGVAAYGALFVRERLYADAGLQIVYFAQGVYGWYTWYVDVRRAEPPVRMLAARWRLIVVIVITGIAWSTGLALARYTDAAAPHWDAAASTTSLAANQLLTRRYLENWALWIAVDVVYVGLFSWKGLHLSAALYLVFLAMAVMGLRQWLRDRQAACAAHGTAPERALA